MIRLEWLLGAYLSMTLGRKESNHFNVSNSKLNHVLGLSHLQAAYNYDLIFILMRLTQNIYSRHLTSAQQEMLLIFVRTDQLFVGVFIELLKFSKHLVMLIPQFQYLPFAMSVDSHLHTVSSRIHGCPIKEWCYRLSLHYLYMLYMSSI